MVRQRVDTQILVAHTFHICVQNMVSCTIFGGIWLNCGNPVKGVANHLSGYLNAVIPKLPTDLPHASLLPISVSPPPHNGSVPMKGFGSTSKGHISMWSEVGIEPATLRITTLLLAHEVLLLYYDLISLYTCARANSKYYGMTVHLY